LSNSKVIEALLEVIVRLRGHVEPPGGLSGQEGVLFSPDNSPSSLGRSSQFH